ncbi:MAG: TetR/AcrR family transcriptional regulator [Eubacteriaceae bacterium]|nr:TetR/AcrR family transcriptional regulator [Eubacteriaceae bacterium]
MRKLTTEDKIYKAAKQLFYKRGYYGTTTRDITTKSGTNLGLIKYYFGSKKIIAYRVIKEVIEEIISQIEKNIKGAEDPILFSMVYMNLYLSVLLNDRQLEAFMVESYSDEVMDAADDAFYDSYLYKLNHEILKDHSFLPELDRDTTIHLNLMAFNNAVTSIGRLKQKNKIQLTEAQYKAYIIKFALFGIGVNIDKHAKKMQEAERISTEIMKSSLKLKEPERLFK